MPVRRRLLGSRQPKDKQIFCADSHLRGIQKGRPLNDRVRCALQDNAVEPWVSALVDLLTILGDDEKPEEVSHRHLYSGSDGSHARKLASRCR